MPSVIHDQLRLIIRSLRHEIQVQSDELFLRPPLIGNTENNLNACVSVQLSFLLGQSPRRTHATLTIRTELNTYFDGQRNRLWIGPQLPL